MLVLMVPVEATGPVDRSARRGGACVVAEIGSTQRGLPLPPTLSVAGVAARGAPTTRSRGPVVVIHRYRTLALALDLLAGSVAAAFATLLRVGSDPGPTYAAVSLLAPVLWVLAIAARRGYETRFLGRARRSTATWRTRRWASSSSLWPPTPSRVTCREPSSSASSRWPSWSAG